MSRVTVSRAIVSIAEPPVSPRMKSAGLYCGDTNYGYTYYGYTYYKYLAVAEDEDRAGWYDARHS